jgi:hypothetical protein
MGVIIQIQLRRDVAADWTAANPVLADGEIGLETDTDQFKIGDGTTAWATLPYGGIAGATGPTGPAGQMGPPGMADDPDEPLLMPGPQGPKGDQGDAGVGGHTIADDGVAETQRGTLDFQTGFIVTDNAGAASTDVDIDAAAIDHGGLAGLADDDHTQYATNTEFDDHSLRHEDAGADEISIAGLSGVPAELTTHAGAADPHTGYRLESVSGTFTVGGLIDGNGAVIATGTWIVWRVPFDCTVTAVHAQVDTGITTVINAGKGFIGGTTTFMSANVTIDPADAWEAGVVNQNQALIANDAVYIQVVTAGTATMVTIQVTLTRP